MRYIGHIDAKGSGNSNLNSAGSGGREYFEEMNQHYGNRHIPDLINPGPLHTDPVDLPGKHRKPLLVWNFWNAPDTPCTAILSAYR